MSAPTREEFVALLSAHSGAARKYEYVEAYVRLDSLPPDPRIEAWRALNAETRGLLLGAWARTNERTGARLRREGNDALFADLSMVAIAALEALAEKS